MKTSLKDKLIQVLLLSNKKERYNALVALLMGSDIASPAQKRFYNACGFSPRNLDALEYDLKKLANVSDSDVRRAKKAVKKIENKEVVLTGEERLKQLDPEASEDILLQEAIDLVEYSKLDKMLPPALPKFAKGHPGNAERKAWLEKENVQHSFTRKSDLDKIIAETHKSKVNIAHKEAIKNLLNAKESLLEVESEINELGVFNAFNESPEAVKTSIKLRDEFPFLKEDDCPNQFKILVADKFTAYDNYIEARAEVRSMIEAGASNNEIFEIAKKAVENFELNLEIYDELNYYKEHGEVLGKHPIFEDLMLQQSVDNLSQLDLGKRQKTLRANISRDTTKMNKMEAGDKKDAFSEKLDKRKKELELVDARIAKIS